MSNEGDIQLAFLSKKKRSESKYWKVENGKLINKPRKVVAEFKGPDLISILVYPLNPFLIQLKKSAIRMGYTVLEKI